MNKRARGIIVFNNHILTISIKKSKGNYHSFPGGHVEKGESLRKCCEREIYEETGLSVVVGDMFFKSSEKNHATYYFLCEIEGITGLDLPKVEIIGEELDRDGEYSAVWISRKKLRKIHLYPKKLVKKIEKYLTD